MKIYISYLMIVYWVLNFQIWLLQNALKLKKLKYLHLLWCFWHSCLTFHCFFDFFRVHFPWLLSQYIGHCRLVTQVSGKMYSMFHKVLKRQQEKTRFCSIFSQSHSTAKLFRLYHGGRTVIPALTTVHRCDFHNKHFSRKNISTAFAQIWWHFFDNKSITSISTKVLF